MKEIGKKFGKFATMSIAAGAMALTFAGGASAADDEETPTQNVWRTSDRGTVNPGGTGSVTEIEYREGSQGTTVDSYVAELPEFTCPNVNDGTDAFGSKGLAAGVDMAFGGACG